MSYKSGSTSGPVGDSRSTTRHEPSRRDAKPHTQPNSSTSPPNGRTTHASDQEHHSVLRRHVSSGSTSSSDYSSGSKDAKDARPDSESKVKRRSGGSGGASDRRRLAIVQMDSETTRLSSQPHGNGIRSRRGHSSNLAGLASVGPHDAAINSDTPPSTAPISGSMTTRDASDTESNTRQGRGHHKSSSEILNTNIKNPRDVGIVGTSRLSPIKDAYKGQGSVPKDDLHLPIFQQPHSRSPSPGAAPDVSDPMRNILSLVHPKQLAKRRSTEASLVITPGVGERKDVGTRVVTPVVTSVESVRALQAGQGSSQHGSPIASSSTPQIVLQSVPPGTTVFPPSDTSPYLNYQPGTHATAGPLPPPPRATFNIDVNAPPPPRPPRLNSPNPGRSRGDIEAVKQALQLPPSVSAALASRSPKTGATTLESSKVPSTRSGHSKENTTTSVDSPVLRHVKSIHRREGASSSVMTVSDITTSDQVSIPESAPHISGRESDSRLVDAGKPWTSQPISEESPPIAVVQSPNTEDEPEKHRNGHVDFSSTLLDGRKSDEVSTGSHSPSRSVSQMKRSDTPSPPPKSFRNSLTTNLKRFASLPRTPSMSSRSSKSVRRLSSPQPSSGTASPSEPSSFMFSAPIFDSSPAPQPRPKIRSQYPSAMHCSEVFGRKTAVERCAIYAHKINELYMYDSGLGDWIIETKIRANVNRPVLAGGNTFTPQPRHTSRASMISEATFPRRPDASAATDLSLKATDLSPTVPPALPYPSLAQNQRFPARTSSLTSGTLASSIRSIPPAPSLKAGGFFASLGRKASMSGGRGKPGSASPVSSSSSSRTKHSSKTPSAHLTARPINIPNNPSIPGGPRAPPNRALRSQTVMGTGSPFSSTSSNSDETLTHRPSLFNLTQEPEPIIDIRADPEFIHQVDKLAELLPHADRDVLAGYLRRSGQDILAIGQYLEDEKNGTLKT